MDKNVCSVKLLHSGRMYAVCATLARCQQWKVEKVLRAQHDHLLGRCVLHAYVSRHTYYLVFEIYWFQANASTVPCTSTLWVASTSHHGKSPTYRYHCLLFYRKNENLIQATRKVSEILYHRIGAAIMCEDQFNQTTCICNGYGNFYLVRGKKLITKFRRDKCNSIHTRTPHNTYSEGLFKGVINFDIAIAKIDPR